MIKAVIFDLDGTLLDTKGDIAASHNNGLRLFGFPERPLDDFNQIIGGGIMEAIRRSAPEGTPHETIVELNKIYQEYYPAHCAEKTIPYEGMVETVQKIGEAGIPMAIFTNKTEPTAVQLAARFFPDTKFEFVWGNDGRRPLKPAPDAGFTAADILGLDASEIAYVGDSDSDIYFALRAGMYAVGAVWGFRGREELEGAGAQLLAETPHDLLRIL